MVSKQSQVCNTDGTPNPAISDKIGAIDTNSHIAPPAFNPLLTLFSSANSPTPTDTISLSEVAATLADKRKREPVTLRLRAAYRKYRAEWWKLKDANPGLDNKGVDSLVKDTPSVKALLDAYGVIKANLQAVTFSGTFNYRMGYPCYDSKDPKRPVVCLAPCLCPPAKYDAGKCSNHHIPIGDHCAAHGLPLGDHCDVHGKELINDGHLIQHSGLAVLDFDHLDTGTVDVQELMRRARGNPSVILAFPSPSSVGVKIVVLLPGPWPDSNADHRAIYDALMRWAADAFGVEAENADRANSDVSRLCFLCYAPDVFYNPAALPADLPAVQPLIDDRPVSRQAAIAGHISESDLTALLKGIDANRHYPEWLAIGSAYKLAGGNLADWQDWCQGASRRTASDTSEGKWNRLPPNHTVGTLVHYFKQDSPGAPVPGVSGNDAERRLAQIANHYSTAVDNGKLIVDCPVCGVPDRLNLLARNDTNRIDALCRAAGCSARKIGVALEMDTGVTLNPGKPQKETAPRLTKAAGQNGQLYGPTLMQLAGEAYGKEAGKMLLYNPASGYWWRFDGRIWLPLFEKHTGTLPEKVFSYLLARHWRIANWLDDNGHAEAAQVIADTTNWTAKSGLLTPFFIAMRDSIAGADPTPKAGVIGTPTEVIDLHTPRPATATPIKHGPEHGLRAITAGNYLPGEAVQLRQELGLRFAKVFTPAVLDQLILHLGLALTGEGQEHRSIMVIIGASGSGKGGTANTIIAAYGGLAATTDNDWLAGRKTAGANDESAAKFLETRPAIVGIDEVGFITNRRLMALTGNTGTSASRKFGHVIEGQHSFVLLLTSVDSPSFYRGGGTERRVAAYNTTGELTQDDIDGAGGRSQRILDAVVTCAIEAAAKFYNDPNWKAPVGNPSAKELMLARADQMGTWIDTNELAGLPASEALTMFKQSDPNNKDLDDITQSRFTRAVNQSRRWSTRPRRGKTVIVAKQEQFDEGELDTPETDAGECWQSEISGKCGRHGGVLDFDGHCPGSGQ